MADLDLVDAPDSEEEYPPVRSRFMAPPTFGGNPAPVRPPVGPAPDIRDSGGGFDLPPVMRPSGGPSFDEAVRGSTGERPTVPEYAPPVQHGWKRVADSLLPYVGNLALPGFGTKIASTVPGSTAAYNQDFSKRLGNYNRAEKDYETRLKDTLAQSREENEEPLMRAQTGETEARADALRNPLPKEGLTPQEQTLHDLMTGQNGQPRVNPDTGRPYTYLEAYTATMQAAQDVKPEKTPKAVSGTLNGRPHWGVQTDKGWVDPQTNAPIPDFQPAPSFAETGLYEPTTVPTPGGGMAPAVFNRRTGTVTRTNPQNAPIPGSAQKEINSDLASARNLDRLEGAQEKILGDVEKRGQQGPMGGGPYLNGPESMQFVSNHIAMTFGGVKGARVGRDLIEAHIKARDLDQSTEAIAQRVLAGGVITYQQAQQMMETAKINRASMWNQAKEAAEQYGVPDAVKLPTDIGASVGAPKAGDVEDGYRFKGGDPADQKNWERVQK